MKNLWNLICLALLLALPSQLCFSQTNFYEGFSWNSHQGKDFITSAKDQGEQGPCHIFAAVAQVESMFKLLYYNPGTELNLSEYQMYSRCLENAFPGDVDYTKVYPFLADPSKGVVDEDGFSAFEYPDQSPFFNDCADDTESDCCIDPVAFYRFQVSYNSINIGAMDTRDIQQYIYENGPIEMYIASPLIHNMVGGGAHALLLHGWTKSGDRLKWIFKDSWHGMATQTYFVDVDSIDLPGLYPNGCKATRITSVNRYKKVGGVWGTTPDNPTRGCSGDVDGDGYCFWGVGDKPASCSSSHSEQDYDDGDPSEGPLDYITGLPIELLPQPYLTAPVAQQYIYGPPHYGGYCGSSHNINSSYWKNITGDQLDWYPYYGSTPTSYTGPSGNAPGGIGLYLYLEATGGCYNQKGIVESKYYYYIPDVSTNYSLKYYYHMYGSTMGSLKVKFQVYPNTAWVEYGATKSGNKGNYWKNESISLSGLKGKAIKIRFEGTTGYGQYSDMAIQNISIIQSGSKGAGAESAAMEERPIEQTTPVFEVYPNPASNQLNINVSGSVDYHLSIYNAQGQLVYDKDLKSSHVLDVNGFSDGLYFIQITYNDPEPKVFVENIVIN